MEIVHVSQVEKGMRCACHCQQCNEPLIAKKGVRNLHHFAHQANTSCDGAAETLLHAAGVEAFLKLREIRLPEYIYRGSRQLRNGRTVAAEVPVLKSSSIRFDGVTVGPRLSSVIPDVVITRGSRSLAIEIVVTHDVDRTKERRLRRLRLPAIRIRLDRADAYLQPAALHAKLRLQLGCKSWIYHPKQLAAEAAFLQKVREGQREYRAIASAERQASRERARGDMDRYQRVIAAQIARTRASWDRRLSTQDSDPEQVSQAAAEAKLTAAEREELAMQREKIRLRTGRKRET